MSSCHGDGNCGQTALLADSAGAPLASSRLVAIVGPPNSGKSTLFNRLTGLRQRVANFPGVTVEHRLGKAQVGGHFDVDLVDLPGIYSLSPRSEDERVAYDVLHGRMAGLPRLDAILLILDSTNLSRHLTLAAPILALGLPTLVLLNMADDLRSRGGHVDVESLTASLGAPVVAHQRRQRRRRGAVDSISWPAAMAMPAPRGVARAAGRAQVPAMGSAM